MMPQQQNATHSPGRRGHGQARRNCSRRSIVVSRRSFLTAGAAGAVAAGVGATEASAQAHHAGTMTADVVIIGAGVAGLPAAITARDARRLGDRGRGELRHRRPRHAERRARAARRRPRAAAEVQHQGQRRPGVPRLGAPRRRREPLQRPRAGARLSPTRTSRPTSSCSTTASSSSRSRSGRSDASTVPRIFVTKEWHIPAEVVAPRRNRNGSGLVRRLAESARKKGAQILLKHRMTRIIREQPTSGRVLGIEVQGRRAHHQHPRHQGRDRRDRRPHRQRQLPPHVRSAADRGIPAGLRALCRPGRLAASSPRWTSAPRCGRPRSRPSRPAPPSPRRGTSAAAGATPRWSMSPTASCSRRPRPPASP